MEETAAVREAQSFQLKTPLLSEGRTNKSSPRRIRSSSASRCTPKVAKMARVTLN
jgi:hypothetical protein